MSITTTAAERILGETSRSKYLFEEISPAEIRISAPGRKTVVVGMEGRAIHVCINDHGDDEGDGRRAPLVRDRRGARYVHAGMCYGYALPDFYGLLDGVADRLMSEWEVRDVPGQGSVAKNRIDTWALDRTKWAVGPKLYAFWRRALELADPQVLAVHKNVFAATFTFPIELSYAELYRNPWLARDLGTYRAAAIALANLEYFWGQARRAVVNRLEDSPEARALQARARELGMSARFFFDSGHFRNTPRAEQLGLLENWRGLYSPDGEPYRSLDRTLMNLPGGVSYKLPPMLSKVRLDAPITERSTLTVLGLHLDNRRGDGLVGRDRVYMNATPDRIKHACELLGAHLRRPLNWRRTEDLGVLVRFLDDCHEEHNGNIVGLVERSIDWHRHRQQRDIEKSVERLGGARETAPPPIPPPDGVEFLATVDAICEEATRMANCVAGYARGAVEGDRFLFHVDRDGEQATVEVDRAGRVVQAAGPRNSQNSAARWGARVLQQWAQAWPEDLPPVRQLPPVARRGGGLGAEGLEDFDDVFGDGIPFQPA